MLCSFYHINLIINSLIMTLLIYICCIPYCSPFSVSMVLMYLDLIHFVKISRTTKKYVKFYVGIVVILFAFACVEPSYLLPLITLGMKVL